MSEELDYENMTDEELMNIAVPDNQSSSETVPPAPEEKPVDEPMFIESTNTTLEDSLDADAETVEDVEENNKEEEKKAVNC